MAKYAIRFDHDGSGDPPAVLIHETHGPDVIKVYEEPAQAGEDDWVPGPLATKVVELLNWHEAHFMGPTTGSLAPTTRQKL